MQYAVAWASTRSQRLEALVKSDPTVLVWRGALQHAAMRRARVTETEVLAACRQAGVGCLDDATAVVLETAGDFSVIRGDLPPPRAGSSTGRAVRYLPRGGWDAGRPSPL